MASGIRVEGIKYQFLRVDGNAAYGKKKDYGSVTLQATQKAVIIVHCPEGGQQGNANKATNAVAEYMESVGY